MSILTSSHARGKHRSSPAELRAEVARLKAEREEFTCHFAELGRTYLQTRDLLDQAGIDLSGALDDVRAAEERATEAERLRDEEHAELVALRARVANLDPFHVPVIGHRDIDPSDQPTEVTDVSDLRARYADDYINRTPQAWAPIPLHQSPQATVPTGEDSETTLTMRFPVAGRRVTATGDCRAKATA
jgi:hypothetical protein